MRPNPKLDIGAAITELAVGEALVSFLDEKGRPGVTERVYVLPPASHIGPISPSQRQALLTGSIVAGVYDKAVDRESAFEKLRGRTDNRMPQAGESGQGTATGQAGGPAGAGAQGDAGNSLMGGLNDILFGSTGPRGARRDGLAQTMAKSAVRTIGTSVGREILRGVLGGIFGKKR
jgi:DNA helicase HerA-like ATPase